MSPDQRIPLSEHEMDAMMPPGDMVHTIMQAGPTIMGCEVPRDKLLALARSGYAELAGEEATARGHGIGILEPGGVPFFVATREAGK
jgi:hypothetical protein